MPNKTACSNFLQPAQKPTAAMKFVFAAVLCFECAINGFAQRQYAGIYHDFFSSKILLDSNFTYNYEFHFDQVIQWGKGTWRIENNTIIFNPQLVYDTVEFQDLNGNITDSLSLSVFKAPRLIRIDTLNSKRRVLSNGKVIYEAIIPASFIPSSQVTNAPTQLQYYNEKLYHINSRGRLDRRRIRGFWTHKKFHSWYIRE